MREWCDSRVGVGAECFDWMNIFPAAGRGMLEWGRFGGGVHHQHLITHPLHFVFKAQRKVIEFHYHHPKS